MGGFCDIIQIYIVTITLNSAGYAHSSYQRNWNFKGSVIAPAFLNYVVPQLSRKNYIFLKLINAEKSLIFKKIIICCSGLFSKLLDKLGALLAASTYCPLILFAFFLIVVDQSTSSLLTDQSLDYVVSVMLSPLLLSMSIFICVPFFIFFNKPGLFFLRINTVCRAY